VIKLEARQADGSPLPTWLGFDGITGLFNGAPPAGAEVPRLRVEVLARDDVGREARTAFTVLGSEAASLDSSDRGFPAVRLSHVQLGLAADAGEALVRWQPITPLRVAAGQGVGFTVPGDAFAHTNPRALVRLQATLAGGEPLPAWLSLDGITGRLSGTAPADFAGQLEIVVTARDTNGLVARTTLQLSIVRDAAQTAGADLNGDGDEQGLAWRQAAQSQDTAREGGEAADASADSEGGRDGEREARAADATRDGKAPAADKTGKDAKPAKRAAAPSFGDQLRSVREQGPAQDAGRLVDRALAAKPAPQRPA
jgi:hypothetical protein